MAMFLFLSAGNLFAKGLYAVSCESPGITTENQFELNGTLTIDDEGNADGVFSYSLRARGNESEIIDGTVERSGTTNQYSAGTMNNNLDVLHVQLVDQEDDLVYISIVANHPDVLSSRLRFKNGLVYKSKCSIE